MMPWHSPIKIGKVVVWLSHGLCMSSSHRYPRLKAKFFPYSHTSLNAINEALVINLDRFGVPATNVAVGVYRADDGVALSLGRSGVRESRCGCNGLSVCRSVRVKDIFKKYIAVCNYSEAVRALSA